MLVGAGLAMYLAAYDAVEPLGQEFDHISRWDGLPQDHGLTLLRHLPAALVVMVGVGIIANEIADRRGSSAGE